MKGEDWIRRGHKRREIIYLNGEFVRTTAECYIAAGT